MNEVQQNLISILVSNHFGVLMRVTTIFSRRTCNIRSLTVAETQDTNVSRITILFDATAEVALQIHKLLEKQEDVIGATFLPISTPLVRELALVKVQLSDSLEKDLAAMVEGYHVKVLSRQEGACVVEFVGTGEQTDNFVQLMEQYGIVEICRTGAAALNEGTENIYKKENK